MSERLPQSEDARRNLLRDQFAGEIALWDVESEFPPEAVERALTIMINREPPQTDEEHNYNVNYSRNWKAKHKEDK